MLTPSQVSRSLILFTLAIVVVGAAFGHALTAVGIALFFFFLAAIEGKPSWKRIFNPDRRGEGGVLRTMSWKWPNAKQPKR